MSTLLSAAMRSKAEQRTVGYEALLASYRPFPHSSRTHVAQGAIFLKYFCIATTFGVPTSSSVAHA